MKKLLVISIGFVIPLFSFAQSNTSLKGPKAKNATVQERTEHAATTITVREPLVVEKGPKAKHTGWWRTDNSAQLQVIPLDSLTGRRYWRGKGPRAKNRRVYRTPAQ